MDDCCDLDCETLNRRQRRTLTQVLVINVVLFLVILVGALIAKSSSMLSGTIDNLGDAITYGLSLYAVSRGARQKAQVSLFKGFLILGAALFVLGHVVYKLFHPEAPVFEVMGGLTLVSLAANGACLALLWKHRKEDINMASVWECSRNDVVENLSVLLAALGVWLTRAQWPDLVVAGLLVLLLFRSAIGIIRSSWAALAD